MEFTEAWNDSCSSVGLAARNGKVKELKRLICKRHPVDVADNRGWRPLHEASAKSLSCMEELLKHDQTDVNWQTYEGETALLLACKHRRTDALKAVDLLVYHGANVNLPDNEEETPLLAAMRSGLTDVVQALLNTREVDTNLGDCSGWRPLHESAMHGQIGLVRSLLAAGAQLDVKDECNMTPLFSAAQYGSLECLKFLLETAKERGQLYLVDCGAQDWATPLMIAAQQGFMDCVKLLLSYGANPNAHAVDNVTALHLAVQGKHKEMLELLLQVMDVDVLKNKCISYSDPRPIPEMVNPLHLAVDWESHACLKLLLDAGFNINSVFTRRELSNEELLLVPLPHLETPLSLAFRKNDIESAKMLLKYGADVNSQVPNVLPPLYSAILNGTSQHIDMLVENGADLRPHDSLLVAMLKPVNLFHLLCRGADPGSCLSGSSSALAESVFQIQKQDEIIRVVKLLLVFLGRDCRTSDFVGTVVARSREKFLNAHDLNSWNLILETIASPSSLTNLCRATLRHHLCRSHGPNFLAQVANLPLPISLLSFLNYEDVIFI